MKNSTKILLLLMVAFLAGHNLFAQGKFFSVISGTALKNNDPVAQNLKKATFVELNEQGIKNYLAKAPMEFKNNGAPLSLEVPLPDGTNAVFAMVESPVQSPELAIKHPEIKTYAGTSTSKSGANIRLSLTPYGFNAIILNGDGNNIYFEKYAAKENIYFTYFTKDAIAPEKVNAPHYSCGKSISGNTTSSNILSSPTLNSFSTGTVLKNYQLALAATGEFTGQHGGTQASSYSAIVGYVNRMNAVYRQELSVNLVLVANEMDLIYTNAATDPYTGTDESTMLDENQTNVDAVIGDANYDIGHAFSWRVDYGSGGGIAASPSLGQTGVKATGASIEGAGYAQVFYDQLLFHEIGHQFGMSHSYNSNIPVCTTRRLATSAEPGSGATIMSYGFTCGTDDYIEGTTTTGPILKFHALNYDQAVVYMGSIPTVGTETPTGNTPPSVTVPGSFTIPISTPFSLTGTATGPAGHTLSYDWEGTNIGLATVPDATVFLDPSKPPFFRSYDPKPLGTRVYPLLSAILDGTNAARGEKLPSIGITTTHRLTVRDISAVDGGVNSGNVTVTVNGSIGPFLETTNLSGSYSGNSTQTITWSVNGTNAATPNVKISLSTDGGITFPTVLLASTPNNGSAIVTFPSANTTTARIKVEAIGNIFFDISNSDFIISTPLPIELISFNAVLQGKNDALLKWQTTSEINNKGYEVEMAEGNGTYRMITFVAGKGNSGVTNDYQTIVSNLAPGVYYFRLKIISTTSQFTYSPIRTLTITNSSSDVARVYPNPVKDGFAYIELANANNKKVTIKITNAVGQLISTNDYSIYNEPLKIKVPVTAGIYNLQIMVADKIITVKKLTVIR